jgi:hypothetical protein
VYLECVRQIVVPVTLIHSFKDAFSLVRGACSHDICSRGFMQA